MNTTELNASEIGSASTLPGVYIRGALAVYAVSVAIFTTTGFQQVYGQALARASAVGLFGAVFHVYAKSDATVQGSFVVRAIQYLRSVTQVAATTSAKFSVGIVARVYGAASLFVVGRLTPQVQIVFAAVTSAMVTTLVRFGLRQIAYGSSEPAATATEAGFTTFGEYAPEARFILVQTEDRKATVV